MEALVLKISSSVSVGILSGRVFSKKDFTLNQIYKYT